MPGSIVRRNVRRARNLSHTERCTPVDRGWGLVARGITAYFYPGNASRFNSEQWLANSKVVDVRDFDCSDNIYLIPVLQVNRLLRVHHDIRSVHPCDSHPLLPVVYQRQRRHHVWVGLCRSVSDIYSKLGIVRRTTSSAVNGFISNEQWFLWDIVLYLTKKKGPSRDSK